MSWIEDIENIQLQVTTGDGKIYNPLWKDASKNISFNVESFDFIGVEGSYIERLKKSGTKYQITFIFQGENHLKIAKEFELSSADSNPWTIIHPFYDSLIVQPLNLNFDNSQLNMTTITGTVAETIERDYPRGTDDFKSNVLIIKGKIKVSIIQVFTQNFNRPKLKVIESANIANESIGKKYQLLTKIPSEITILKDLIRKISSAINTISSNAEYYMNQVLSLIDFPFEIEQNIEANINILIENFNTIKLTFVKDDMTRNDFEMLQSYSSSILSTICSCVVINEDYDSRNQIYDIVDLLKKFYDDLINTYDSTGFNQNDDLALLCDNIITTTISNLYGIAFFSKQIRQIILEKDDNIINLAHRFYGAGDENLQKFITENNITLDEHLQVKKDRKIIYFV